MGEDRNMTAFPCLSVIVPCYNEAATIKDLLERTLQSPWVREVLVVDDGSTDGTRQIAESIQQARLKVLPEGRHQGKGAAVRRGFSEATSEFVVVQDADLEYDPAEYDLLIQHLITGAADVVYGSRFLTNRPHRVLYFWHSVANRLLTTASNAVTNLNLTDLTTCYKMLRREVVQSLDLRENRFGIEPEMTAKIAKAKWRIYEVGISYFGRTYASGKKVKLLDGLDIVRCILRYSWLWEGRA